MQNLKTTWQHKPTLAGWLHLGHPFVAELMAAAGFEVLVADHQHAPFGLERALELVMTTSRTTAAPFVRVSWNDPAEMMKFLDAGALGIICPMINNRAQAEDFVAACRYPPRGIRSFGPTRAGLLYGTDYAEHADERVITMAMIETKSGVENLDEILSVPELDGIFVGPSDLNQSLGNRAKLDSLDLDFLQLLEQIAQKTTQAGKVAGLFCGSSQYALRMQSLGYTFLVLSSDSRLLTAVAKQTLEAFRQGTSLESGGY
ncbi:MAG: HpcH/HpaI aldolase family protein [Deinococcales bacterium]